MDSALLRYTQPSNMTLIQYADDLFAKLCKVADVYDESILDDIFIKGVEAYICHSLKKFWACSPQSDLADIAFLVQQLLAI